jgi:ParE toxin of type II toxin-antitoxin system, parDE
MPNENDVLFHPEAADEYANSYAWYCEKVRHVAEAFEREVKRSLRLIATYPMRWPVYRGQYRRIMVRRFPFSLVYGSFEGHLVIVAVAHGSRRPGYWRDRKLSDAIRRSQLRIG